jgi:hypothetical protein
MLSIATTPICLSRCLAALCRVIWFCRRYRIVAAGAFLQRFASDRSHMRRPDGSWMSPPPRYPCIVAHDGCTNNLHCYRCGCGRFDQCKPYRLTGNCSCSMLSTALFWTVFLQGGAEFLHLVVHVMGGTLHVFVLLCLAYCSCNCRLISLSFVV